MTSLGEFLNLYKSSSSPLSHIYYKPIPTPFHSTSKKIFVSKKLLFLFFNYYKEHLESNHCGSNFSLAVYKGLLFDSIMSSLLFRPALCSPFAFDTCIG